MKDLNLLIDLLNIETAKPPSQISLKKIIKEIAKFYMENLDANEDEVSIFLADHEKSMLSFACPQYLVDSGVIPVSSTEAIVANIFRTGQELMVNSFNQQKHLSVFEIIKTPDNRIKPIWKVLGTLIEVQGEKLGVIEISRRAEHNHDAGKDFTHDELIFLKNSIVKLAIYIKKAIPKNFKGKLET